MADKVKQIHISVKGINVSKGIAQECKELASAIFCIIMGALLSSQLLSDIIARIKTSFTLQDHFGPGTAFYAPLHIWGPESKSDDQLSELMFDVSNFSLSYSYLTNSGTKK
jgi:hypothetical protein